jgi:hypothetical protein
MRPYLKKKKKKKKTQKGLVEWLKAQGLGPNTTKNKNQKQKQTKKQR